MVGAGAVRSIDPLSLVLLRWVIAVVPLLVIAQIVERPCWRAILTAWLWLIALGMLGLLGYNLLLYFALEHTNAFNASLINAFNPVDRGADYRRCHRHRRGDHHERPLPPPPHVLSRQPGGGISNRPNHAQLRRAALADVSYPLGYETSHWLCPVRS